MFSEFTALDEEFLAELVATATETAHACGATHAYLGGSPLAGLGTPNSDADLFLVVDDGRSAGGSRQVVVGTNRIDVETSTKHELDAALELCSAVRTSDSDLDQLNQANLKVLDRLVRAAHSRVLVDDDGWLADFTERVRARAGSIVELLVSQHCLVANNSIEDAEGFLLVGHWRPAEQAARRALLCAAEALLARHGDVYVGPKWVWDRWRRSLRSPEWAGLEDVVVSGVDADGPDGVDGELWLAQDLMLGAIVKGAVRPHPPSAPLPPGVLRRSPYHSPLPVPDAVLVYRSRHKVVRLSDQGGLLWQISHGRTRDDAIARTAEVLARQGRPVAATDVAAYLESLLRAGLVVAPEASGAQTRRSA